MMPSQKQASKRLEQGNKQSKQDKERSKYSKQASSKGLLPQSNNRACMHHSSVLLSSLHCIISILLPLPDSHPRIDYFSLCKSEYRIKLAMTFSVHVITTTKLQATQRVIVSSNQKTTSQAAPTATSLVASCEKSKTKSEKKKKTRRFVRRGQAYNEQ